MAKKHQLQFKFAVEFPIVFSSTHGFVELIAADSLSSFESADCCSVTKFKELLKYHRDQYSFYALHTNSSRCFSSPEVRWNYLSIGDTWDCWIGEDKDIWGRLTLLRTDRGRFLLPKEFHPISDVVFPRLEDRKRKTKELIEALIEADLYAPL